MNRFITYCCGSLLLACAGSLKANPAVDIPSGDIACSVTVTSHRAAAESTSPDNKDAEAAETVLHGVEITRIGKLQRDEMTWSDGRKTEAWTLLESGMILTERIVGGSSFIYEIQKGSAMRNVLCPTLLDMDQSSLSWINDQSFTGKTDFKSRAALHYQSKISLPTPGGPARVALYQAWIDAKTLIPLAYDDGDALYDLTFSDPPTGTGPLVLPDRFRKDLQEYENANAKIRHL